MVDDVVGRTFESAPSEGTFTPKLTSAVTNVNLYSYNWWWHRKRRHLLRYVESHGVKIQNKRDVMLMLLLLATYILILASVRDFENSTRPSGFIVSNWWSAL